MDKMSRSKVEQGIVTDQMAFFKFGVTHEQIIHSTTRNNDFFNSSPILY
jgi:hypothetical protein